jgi:hypothetical protein
MSGFVVPVGLRKWQARIAPILKKPFPPPGEPMRVETPHWHKISTCSMFCEEVLDTEPTPGLLTQYYHELLRRGFADEEIQEMRHFVWLTVGWLNFEKALWEWCVLDESDIRKAIDWQHEEGLIDAETARSMHEYLTDKLKNSEPCAAPNGGPAKQLGNSGVTEGPPSVS